MGRVQPARGAPRAGPATSAATLGSMEKLVYLLWPRVGEAPRDLCARLLGSVATALRAESRGPVSLLLADAAAEAAERAAIRRTQPPIAGVACVWLDCSTQRAAIEATLAGACGRVAGYLVSESAPLRNTTHRAPIGERTPGITMLALLERPPRLDPEEWLRIWYEEHGPVALELQCTYRYVRNAVVRRLTPDAPAFAGIVEEGFPAEAITDPHLWYRTGGSADRLRDRIGQMVASVRRFLDVEKIESLPMSEYVLREWS